MDLKNYKPSFVGHAHPPNLRSPASERTLRIPAVGKMIRGPFQHQEPAIL